MSKSKLIFMAVLMVIASILIVFLSEQGVEKSMEQLSSFIAGMLLAAGIFLFLNQILKKKG
jgi:ABC-type nickel/cobalt efflux system permease component RcnA